MLSAVGLRGVGAIQSERFADAQSGAVEQREQRLVTARDPAVGGLNMVEEDISLLFRERFRHGLCDLWCPHDPERRDVTDLPARKAAGEAPQCRQRASGGACRE